MRRDSAKSTSALSVMDRVLPYTAFISTLPYGEQYRHRAASVTN